MKTLMGAAVIAAVLAFGGPAAVAARAATPQAKLQMATTSGAIDFSARRRYYRPYRPAPHHYARPYYYRPYPYYAPAPFPFGFGFGPSWW